MSSDQSSGSNRKEVRKGTVVIKQGEPGDCAYIIEKGQVEISLTKPNGNVEVIGTRGPGTMIGEMALIDKGPRTASIRALEDCEFLTITESDFERRIDGADPIIRMMTQVVLARYRDAMQRFGLFVKPSSQQEIEDQELIFSKANTEMEKLKLMEELRDGLKSGDVFLHYQPIVDTQSGQVAGFEALMRWNHFERGFIYPSLFIPVAEETGAIYELSKWALEESAHMLARLEKELGDHGKLFVSVNFASSDFMEPDFVSMTTSIISEAGLQPHQLHVEITERTLIGEPERAQDALEVLKDAGVHISLDDFGTGYSSLSYLRHFKIDTLKIDRSFVSDMFADESAMALIKSIIALAKNMKMVIIAEGAETAEEAMMLRDLGCEMVQGYYYARPMPEDELLAAAQKHYI
ncbi:MAG: cyclic nucleotide-binding protein [Alphaproteobacteria bacterium]|nr:cyclic nucleotide-binding protein [Alphaproteobacteria bacterium]|tara:strand:- start:9124 stop:10344 length:1221 start_codon:yes stop_codon:yes gene_type:complete